MRILKFNINKIILIFFCFLIFISISSAWASDVNETNDNTPGTFDELYNDIQNLHPGDTYNFNKDYVFTEDMTTNRNEYMAIQMNTNGINNDIEYKLYKSLNANTAKKFSEGYEWDYYETGKIPVNGPDPNAHSSIGEKIYSERVIIISCDNVTINGNGHCIDAGGILPWNPNRGSDDFSGNTGTIFKVTGNNVVIVNLTFTNSQPFNFNDHDLPNELTCISVECGGLNYMVAYGKKYVPSPICWLGENGVISDCTFSNNSATTGGAINWIGNNAYIKNVKFINNTARIVGGALFIVASHTLIDNCTFLECGGMLGETIYYDPNSEDNEINLMTTDDPIPFISGSKTNIPIRALENYYLVDLGDDYFDLISLMYLSINVGSELRFAEDKYSVYSYYSNETKQFICLFSYTEVWAGNISCSFTKIFTINCDCDNGNYYNLFHLENNIVNSEMDIIISKAINTAKDYEQSTSLNYANMVKGHLGFLKKSCEKKTTILNLIFKENLYIKSNTLFDASGFDKVNFMGNGATIDGDAESDDEYHWISLDSKSPEYIVNNLIIKKFNSAIVNNGGYCELNSVSLIENAMDYYFERDWGGAILNTGVLVCNNCSFIKNSAKNGGAIFNQGIIYINNSTFKDNYAYNEGDHICMGDGGKAVINGINSTAENQYGPVHFPEKLSLTDVNLIKIGGTVVSFIVGAAVGFGTCNPVLGLLVGGAVAAGIGVGSASYIVNKNFNLNYNRAYTFIEVVSMCVSAGMIGGMLGGWLRMTIQSCSVSPEMGTAKTTVEMKNIGVEVEGVELEVHEPGVNDPNPGIEKGYSGAGYYGDVEFSSEVNMEQNTKLTGKTYKTTFYDYDTYVPKEGERINTGDLFQLSEEKLSTTELYDFYGNKVTSKNIAYLRPIGDNNLIMCDARGLPLFYNYHPNAVEFGAVMTSKWPINTKANPTFTISVSQANSKNYISYAHFWTNP